MPNHTRHDLLVMIFSANYSLEYADEITFSEAQDWRAKRTRALAELSRRGYRARRLELLRAAC